MVWLLLRKRYRPLLRRFCPPIPAPISQPVWIQACSVGEVGVARHLITALRETYPDLPMALTVSTLTGMAQARKTVEGAAITWCPFDLIWTVQRFICRLKPRCLILIETEIWPNIIHQTLQSGAPVFLANGRLSDRHLDRYVRFAFFFRPIFARLAWACMQSEEHGYRARRLGVREQVISVTGNMKYDGAQTSIDQGICEVLRRETGLSEDAPVVVFGSTRPGDELRALHAFQRLRRIHADLRVVIVPRHIERADEIVALLDEPILRRSVRAEPTSDAPVILVDTLGELIHFYALATVAVVGGSFDRDVNGHNPIEPAALGVPVVFGPHMRNFADPAQGLLDGGGARRVADEDELIDVLGELLAFPAERQQMAHGARQVVTENQGATARTLDQLKPFLEDSIER